MKDIWAHYRKVKERDMNKPIGVPYPGIPNRRKKVAEFISQVGKSGLTLELGAENHRFFSDSISIDINRTCLNIPGEKVVTDWHYLPFKENCFDQVIWSEGPEHSHNPSIVFSEIARTLKKNGMVIVTCPSGNAISDWQHLTKFNKLSLKNLLRNFFVEVYVEEWNVYLLSFGKTVK